MASRSFIAGLAVIAVLLVAIGAANAFDPREGGRGFAPKKGHFYEQQYDDAYGDQNCTLEVDLMIAIDGSSSITDNDWQEAVSFLYNVVLGFKLGPNAAQIGVVQFTTQYETYVYCNLTDSVTQLQEGLQNMNQIGGGTNIAEGIIMSQDQIDEHGRSGVPHVIIVITDGMQDDPGSNLNPVTAAGNARLGGSILFGIGVGNEVDTSTMHQVVNTPWQDYYFPVSGYNNLSSILQKTVLSICHPSTTSATSAASSGNSQSSQSSQTSTGGSQSSQSSNSQSSNSQSSNSQSSNSQSSSSSQSSGQSSTGGGTKCGNFNTCAFGDFCCSDGNNPNDPFYCCAGSNRCCEGACCHQGYQCYNGQCIGGIF